MTTEKPRERRERPIYLTLFDKSGPKTKTRSLSIYGGTLEQVEHAIRIAFSGRRKSTATS